MKKLSIALLMSAAAFTATQANATALTGTFAVELFNYDAGGSAAAASATQANLDANDLTASFTYTGALDFNIVRGNSDTVTVADFLASGSGTVTGLDTAAGDLRLSFPTFTTTSLFSFSTTFDDSFDFDVTHDDGISVFDDGEEVLAFSNPTGVRTTAGGVFNGGDFELLYVAANGNPSVLEVDFTSTDSNLELPAVPLPASALLLLGGIGGLGAFGRRKAKK